MLLRGIPVLTLKRCPVSMSLCILFTISGKRKASEVWSFFLASQDAPSYTLCKLCDVKVKRGKDGDRSSWSATPLWNHLKRHHPEQHRAASEQKDAVERDAKQRKLAEEKKKEIYIQAGTPKLSDFITKKAKYSDGNPEQIELINKILVDWIADAVLPYSCVDNER